MAQTSLVSKTPMLIPLIYGLSALAGEGTGHSHDENNANMQVLGVFIILIIAVTGFYFLSKKK